MIRTDLPDCFLRPWQESDQAALVALADNRKIWRNLTDLFPHPYTEADAAFWIEFANHSAPSCHVAIVHRGSLVGGIGIIAGEGNARFTGNFGYWLGEPHWGQGIASAAARAMADHAFTHLRFERLEGAVFEWNAASMRVLEKAGFRREGVLRKSVFKDGQLIDSVMHARLRGD
ncbi:GNAT family N-acetyltransferase [Niveibacterium umoris]|uniref:RimJ/RimL family protein N-acetyltransferase n=1 Tax=Niveibacterium umoris TaxID=1193620 RepID=A0A840BLA3_9RHOO|nr:GNAT family protein [Niveibacterium umoris]MBB4013234.1 RimJ/RimL family protein N-acetyltransferase [Niveibacterium umoris]